MSRLLALAARVVVLLASGDGAVGVAVLVRGNAVAVGVHERLGLSRVLNHVLGEDRDLVRVLRLPVDLESSHIRCPGQIQLLLSKDGSRA